MLLVDFQDFDSYYDQFRHQPFRPLSSSRKKTEIELLVDRQANAATLHAVPKVAPQSFNRSHRIRIDPSLPNAW